MPLQTRWSKTPRSPLTACCWSPSSSPSPCPRAWTTPSPGQHPAPYPRRPPHASSVCWSPLLHSYSECKNIVQASLGGVPGSGRSLRGAHHRPQPATAAPGAPVRVQVSESLRKRVFLCSARGYPPRLRSRNASLKMTG